MALCLAAGRWIGERHISDPSRAAAAADLFEVTSSGLVALLLAFTVASAGNRFDDRRRLIVDESNAIGTAYLRLDLLPPDKREQVKALFRSYVDARIEAFHGLPDMDVSSALELTAKGRAKQAEIWALVTEASLAQPGSTALAVLLIPALNEMMDLARKRTLLSQLHPPMVIFIMLVVVLLANSLYAGYGVAGTQGSLIHIVGLLFMKAFVFCVILDLEFPRAGFLREEAFDEALVDLRNSMQ
jgi:hypothetical protein